MNTLPWSLDDYDLGKSRDPRELSYKREAVATGHCLKNGGYFDAQSQTNRRVCRTANVASKILLFTAPLTAQALAQSFSGG